MNFINLPENIKENILQSECEFVLTGGSGWVGRAILDALEGLFQDDLSKKISVFGASNKEIKLLSGRVVHSQPLQNIETLSKGPKIFLHCAFLTRDRLSDLSPAELIKKNREISDLVLLSVKNSNTRGFFSLSSGAVYKKNTHELETDWEINSYGMCKLADEQQFAKLMAEMSIPFVMPRLFNLSGAYINKHETYALASMILSALSQGEIRIHATHQVIRSYVLVDDLLALTFAALLNPQAEDVSIFDTVGAQVLELAALAEKIKEVLDLPDIKILRGELEDHDADRYLGEGSDLNKIALVHGINFKRIDQQIEKTSNYLRQLCN